MSIPIRSLILADVKDKLDDPKYEGTDLVVAVTRLMVEYNAMRAQLLRLESALHEAIKMIE